MLKINDLKKFLGTKIGLMQDYSWANLQVQLNKPTAQININISVKFNWIRTTITLIFKTTLFGTKLSYFI